MKTKTIFKGKKRGMIHTTDITLDHIRAVFFPKDFYEKYRYLGSIPWNTDKGEGKAIYPLVILMDLEARPWWCPRWVLRFLHLFGSDNSIVRVRNPFLHNLSRNLTKGIMFWDWKTKWSDYDLRISVSAPKYIQDLADIIESNYYRKGRRSELKNILRNLKVEFSEYDSLCMLEEKYKQTIVEDGNEIP
jgi:hypothetical protein